MTLSGRKKVQRKAIDPETEITWHINAVIHSADGIKFRWSGGPYIDILVNGVAVDVINVWDYKRGICEIRTVKQFIRKIREYLQEGGMNLG